MHQVQGMAPEAQSSRYRGDEENNVSCWLICQIIYMFVDSYFNYVNFIILSILLQVRLLAFCCVSWQPQASNSLHDYSAAKQRHVTHNEGKLAFRQWIYNTNHVTLQKVIMVVQSDFKYLVQELRNRQNKLILPFWGMNGVVYPPP